MNSFQTNGGFDHVENYTFSFLVQDLQLSYQSWNKRIINKDSKENLKTVLMNVGEMRTSCLWPGPSKISLAVKLLGVSSGAPIRILKSLKFNLLIQFIYVDKEYILGCWGYGSCSYSVGVLVNKNLQAHCFSNFRQVDVLIIRFLLSLLDKFWKLWISQNIFVVKWAAYPNVCWYRFEYVNAIYLSTI